jgi:hypothetical protein
MRLVPDPIRPGRKFRIREGVHGGQNDPAWGFDFCTCARGQEALRWWKECSIAPPALLVEFFDECYDKCDPETGLLRFNGYDTWNDQTDNPVHRQSRESLGFVISNKPWSPPISRTFPPKGLR